MNLISRLSATWLSRVDRTVTLIENHDAVVEASLKESQRVAARARVKLMRVKRDGVLLKARIAELEKKKLQWEQRAQEQHANDRAVALQCISRRNQCIQELTDLDAALKKHNALELDVSNTIESIEKRVMHMTQQRNQMRSRESAAEALRIVNRIDANGNAGLDDAFERWDMSISETEIAAGHSHRAEPIDELEQQFVTTESEQELSADLDALIAESRADSAGEKQ